MAEGGELQQPKMNGNGVSRPEPVSTTGGFHHIDTEALGSPKSLNGHVRGSSVDGQRTLRSFDGPPVEYVLSQRTQTLLRPVQQNAWDLDHYFSGPLDPAKHSKLPFFMRVRGSILPKLILPMTFIAAWSAAIVIISEKVHSLAVDSLLLTVLGFVVGLALSFRSTTAYERYNEGRKYWALLTLYSRQLAHLIWIHGTEREGDLRKDDVLGKLTAINLILAFAQSCKHRLRHQIEYDYTDLKPLIDNLDTFAKRARDADRPASAHNREEKEGNGKSWGEFLGVSFLQSNPRKVYKIAARQGKQHGNLPYEIMGYLGRYIKIGMETGTFSNAIMQGQVYGAFNNLMDAYGGCDRVLSTPLPLAYNIAISQITWLYVIVLPFQLYAKLGWVAIPGTIVAAYIILGLAEIGREIEDPFGSDVNDLDLDRYCQALQYDLNVMTARPSYIDPKDWIYTDENKPLYPYSVSGFNSWRARNISDINAALSGKVSHLASVVHEQIHHKHTSNEREEKLKHNGV